MQPLEGVRIIEVTTNASGPLASLNVISLLLNAKQALTPN